MGLTEIFSKVDFINVFPIMVKGTSKLLLLS